jgi:hypothetical protein
VLLHLSLTVLVHYRSPSQYLALDGVYHLDSGCVPKQPYSEKKRKNRPGQHWFFSVLPQRKYKKKGSFLHCRSTVKENKENKKDKKGKGEIKEKEKKEKEKNHQLGKIGKVGEKRS